MSAFRFRLYWLFGCLCSQDRVAMRFPAKITSSCIWVAMPDHWVILLCYACGADGRSVGRTITRLPKFLGWIDYHIFLGMGLRSREWSSAIRRPIGLLQLLITWSTFSKHENSLLLENSVSRNWKSILKLSNLWTVSRSQRERLERPPKIRRICMRKTTLVT